MLLNSRAEVYTVIQEMTAIFRGIAYYGAGSLVLNQDKPTDSSYVLGPSNVIDGIFTYSGTSQKKLDTRLRLSLIKTMTLKATLSLSTLRTTMLWPSTASSTRTLRLLAVTAKDKHRIGKWTLFVRTKFDRDLSVCCWY